MSIWTRISVFASFIVPALAIAKSTLGWILAKRGSYDKAVPLLRDAVQQSPEVAEIRYHLASALASAGEKEEARTVLDDLLNSEQSFPSHSEALRLSDAL